MQLVPQGLQPLHVGIVGLSLLLQQLLHGWPSLLHPADKQDATLLGPVMPSNAPGSNSQARPSEQPDKASRDCCHWRSVTCIRPSTVRHMHCAGPAVSWQGLNEVALGLVGWQRDH